MAAQEDELRRLEAICRLSGNPDFIEFLKVLEMRRDEHYATIRDTEVEAQMRQAQGVLREYDTIFKIVQEAKIVIERIRCRNETTGGRF